MLFVAIAFVDYLNLCPMTLLQTSPIFRTSFIKQAERYHVQAINENILGRYVAYELVQDAKPYSYFPISNTKVQWHESFEH